MKKESTKTAIGTQVEFKLRNKQTLTGIIKKEYPYKGVIYLQIQVESGKKYLINPKNVKQL